MPQQRNPSRVGGAGEKQAEAERQTGAMTGQKSLQVGSAFPPPSPPVASMCNLTCSADWLPAAAAAAAGSPETLALVPQPVACWVATSL